MPDQVRHDGVSLFNRRVNIYDTTLKILNGHPGIARVFYAKRPNHERPNTKTIFVKVQPSII